MQEHKDGLSTYTKKHLPLDLRYCEVYKSKEDALERERTGLDTPVFVALNDHDWLCGVSTLCEAKLTR